MSCVSIFGNVFLSYTESDIFMGRSDTDSSSLSSLFVFTLAVLLYSKDDPNAGDDLLRATKRSPSRKD